MDSSWTQHRSLEELRDCWDELLSVSYFPDFFCSWAWVYHWWSIYGRGRELAILAFRQGNQLLGIAPLFCERRFGLQRVAFLGSGASDRGVFIVRSGWEEQFAWGLIGALSQYQKWDILDLQELPSDDPVGQALSARNRETARSGLESKLPFVELPSTWEEFLSRYSKKRRDKIRYYPHLLDRSFRWRIEAVSSDQLDEQLALFFHHNIRHWLRKGMPSSFLVPAFRRFHSAIARCGLGSFLRFYYLYLDDIPRAAWYGFCWQRRFYFYLCAQDDAFQRFGLGFVLQIHAIREAIREGCLVFDFLKGLEPYKLHWKPTVAESQRLLLSNRTTGGRIAGGLTWGEHCIVQAIKKRAKRI